MTRARQLLAALLSIVLATSVGLIATGGLVGVGAQQGSASVTMEDQPSDGLTVIVDSVTLPEGGFVVIHDSEELDDGDAIESVLGVSRYLEAGTHEDVPVTVAPELDSADDIEVTAMAHRDTNGNEVFDFVTSEGNVDGAYLVGEEAETETPAPESPGATVTPEGTETPEETETVATPEETETATEEGTEPAAGTETTAAAQVGGPVVDEATIDATGTQVPNASLTFEDQSSDGTTVTVDRVTLYRGGYVVIHDSEELEDGDAIGSVLGNSEYLEPGTHEDVEVTLARPLDAENESEVSVTAMPHFETNENLVFDFVTSLGTEDDPYLDENESALTATATVSTGAAEEETPTETEAPMTPETPEETETTEAPEETETPGETVTTTEAATETTEAP